MMKESEGSQAYAQPPSHLQYHAWYPQYPRSLVRKRQIAVTTSLFEKCIDELTWFSATHTVNTDRSGQNTCTMRERRLYQKILFVIDLVEIIALNWKTTCTECGIEPAKGRSTCSRARGHAGNLSRAFCVPSCHLHFNGTLLLQVMSSVALLSANSFHPQFLNSTEPPNSYCSRVAACNGLS